MTHDEPDFEGIMQDRADYRRVVEDAYYRPDREREAMLDRQHADAERMDRRLRGVA